MAQSEKYIWEWGGPLPVLDAHSLAKHEVLEAYLSQYVRVVAANVRIPAIRLDCVDGFSGGGLYSSSLDGSERYGSPLLFLKGLEAVEAEINLTRKNPLRIHSDYYFVDQNKSSSDFLKRFLAEEGYGKRLGDSIHCIDQDFSVSYRQIIESIKSKHGSGRSIFLLDQCGYNGVSIQILREILTALPNAEILLTFAVDALLTFMNSSSQYRKKLEKLGVSNLHIDSPLLRNKEAGWRNEIEAGLIEEIHRESGANFFTPFFIVSDHTHWAYWLVHLCMHDKAHDEMVKVHWSLHNHFRHYGRAGLRMLGYDSTYDEDVTGKFTFDFGDRAEELSAKELYEDLAQKIYELEDSITFGDLILAIANDTPASSSIVKPVLSNLQANQEIVLVTDKGGSRSSPNQISKTDRIRRHPNYRFMF